MARRERLDMVLKVRVGRDLYSAVALYAEKHSTTVSEAIRRLVRLGLERVVAEGEG